MVYNRKGHNIGRREVRQPVEHQRQAVCNQGEGHSVTTIDAKGLAALTSSFFATLKAIKADPDVITTMRRACVPLRLAHWADIRTVATIHGLDWQRAKVVSFRLHVSEAW